MTLGLKRKDPPSSPSDGSQSYIPADRFINRKWMRVPADQRALLESDGSWAQNLRQGAYGSVNVPAKALRDVKGFRPRKQDPSASRPISPSGKNPALDTPSRQELAASPGGSSPAQATEISWSMSPPEGKRRASKRAQSSPGRSSSSSPSPSPSPHLKSRPRTLFLSDFPSSPAGDEDDLELEVPLALPSASKPANRAAMPLHPPVPTPPSAQVPIIPCTYNTHSSPEKRPEKRSRFAEPLKLDSSPSSEEESHEAQVVEPVNPEFSTLDPGLKSSNTSISTPSFLVRASQEQTSQPLEQATVFDSTLASNSTPSFLNGASQADPSQPSMLSVPRVAQGSQSPSKSQDFSHTAGLSVAADKSGPQVEAHEASQAMTKGPGAALQDAPNGTKKAAPIGNDASPTLNSDSPFPFYHYSTMYQEGEVTPAYEGDKMNFVRACVNLKYIQKHHLLSSFLYDDFIRSFLDFITYVQEMEEGNPLEAYKWYNKTVDRPVYTKGVVTKHNLDSILAKYPREVSHVLGDAADVRVNSSGEESQPVPQVAQVEEAAQEFVEAEAEAEDTVMEAPEPSGHHVPMSEHIDGDSLEQEAMPDIEQEAMPDVEQEAIPVLEQEAIPDDGAPEVAATQDIGVIATQPPITSPRVTQASTQLERTQRIPQTVFKVKMLPPPPPTGRTSPQRPPRKSTTPPTTAPVASPPRSSSRLRPSAPPPPPPPPAVSTPAVSAPGSAVSRLSSTPSRRKDESPEARERRLMRFMKKRKRKESLATSSIVSSSSTGRRK